jgi:hypothetical protein
MAKDGFCSNKLPGTVHVNYTNLDPDLVVKLLDLAQRSGSGQTTLPVGKMVMKHRNFWVAYWRQYLEHDYHDGLPWSGSAGMPRMPEGPEDNTYFPVRKAWRHLSWELRLTIISKSLAGWQPHVRCPLYKCQHPQGPRGVRGVQTQRDDLPPVPGAPRQHQVEAGVRYLAWNLRSAVIRFSPEFWCEVLVPTYCYATGTSAELVVRLL